MHNCVFAENRAEENGGAIAPYQNKILVNCTFYANSAGWECGAVGNYVICTAANCIFWANDAQQDPHFDDAHMTANYCCIEGLPYDSASTNFHADPLFVDPAAGDFRLFSGSACIDAGETDTVSEVFDAAGAPRRQDNPATPDTGNGAAPLVDIGAYEYQPDCNGNGVLDWDDIVAGASQDCNYNKIPDECEAVADCNGNGVADICDIANGTSADEGGNGVPDECDVDCNGNGVFDDQDIANGWNDFNGNGVPDECELPPDVEIIFVKADATGDNTGRDWDNALTNLNAALEFAKQYQAVTRIWVAAGTYRPAPATDRNATLLVQFPPYPQVSLLGGFAGHEDPNTFDPNDRDLTANVSLLSGDIGTPGVDEDNAYHVVTVAGPRGTLDGFTIAGGRASGATNPQGGGVRINVAGPDFTIRRCCIMDNVADVGGGLYADPLARPLISQCVFESNLATDGGGAAAGSEARGDLPPVRFEGCAFVGNAADNGGGGLEASYCVDVSGCVFERNDAEDAGGGLRFEGETLEVVDAVFEDNWAAQYGGGLEIINGVAMFEGVSLVDNWAWSNGGGARVNGATTWSACEFRDNYAQGDGGGLYLRGGQADVTSSIFFANMANNGGAAYKLCDAYLNLTNCTVAENWAMGDDGALKIDCGGDRFVVHNSIIWGNLPWDASSLNANSEDVRYSCIEGGWEGGVGNINKDPRFISVATGDLRLATDSPCLDAGDNSADGLAGAYADFTGEPRFADAGLVPDTGVGLAPIVDIGAHEFGDCNANGVRDREEIDAGAVEDCNANGVPDACDATPWDYDADGAFSVADLDAMLAAWTGPGQSVGSPCGTLTRNAFDADADADVDLRDFSGMQRSWTSPE